MTLQEQLDEAKAQYHLLVTGRAARVFVDQNGERAEYVAANALRLASYIDRLERQIAGNVANGPMRVWM